MCCVKICHDSNYVSVLQMSSSMWVVFNLKLKL